MICKQEHILRIGRDLVDCLTAPLQSHGEIQIDHQRWYRWVSTRNCVESESIIRIHAHREQRHISCLVSQGLSAPFQTTIPSEPPLHRASDNIVSETPSRNPE